MKISFVVPAYNEEARIEKCVRSILDALEEFDHEAEVIVVNNASSDRTRDIAQSIDGIRVVDQPIKGLVHARQAGYDAAAGELVANIDADTIMPSGWIETVIDEFEGEPELVALSGPFYYFDLSPFRRFWVKIFYGIGYISYLFNRFVLNAGSMLQGGNFVVRRSALEQIGGFDTSIRFYGEDTDVARRLHKIGKVRWTFRLPIHASGRRLQHEGLLRMGSRYALNYVWTTFAKKPWSEEYVDIRTDWRD